MRYIFFLLLFILAPYSQAQIIKEYLAGGSFSGKVQQAKHLQWGNQWVIISTINCEILKSFRPLRLSSFKTESFDHSERNNNLFYGANISLTAGLKNSDTVNMRSVAIGPGLLLKYYTPIDLFFQTLIGFEFEKKRIWEPNPLPNTFYTPRSHSFGFKYEFFMGYSFQLPGKVLFEPSISYKILKSNTYFSDDAKRFLPKDSINIYLGFLFIFNK